MPWTEGAEGVVTFPSGRVVRGRGLRAGRPDGQAPQLGVHLLGRPPTDEPCELWWVRWPDFRAPTAPHEAAATLREAWRDADERRVEVACRGGVGRTGTALACFAVLDGLAPADAIALVRDRYRRGAVETPGQRRFVSRFLSL